MPPPAQPLPPRRRTLLLCALPALIAGGLLAALWAGWRAQEQPFVWYNLNRINAVADRAARAPDSVTVVALGDTSLRDSTLDEREMSALAAKRGIERLHFLRIVHNRAEFADFEPLLDRILAIKPTLVLIDHALLTAERGAAEDLARYLRVLAGVPEGRPFLRDQAALQYRRDCGAETESQPVLTESADAAARVRTFMARAWAAGIQVALVQVRQRPDGPGPSAEDLPLWRTAALNPAHACRGGAAAESRTAFSAWMVGGVATLVANHRDRAAPLRTEAASLP